MMKSLLIAFGSLILLLASTNAEFCQTITTYVGPSVPRNGASALAQSIDLVSSVVSDTTGGFYFVSSAHNRVYRVSNDLITVVAGSGAYGFGGDGGRASLAQLASPWGVARDKAGNLYITDTDNRRIRKVTPDGVITTLVKERRGLSGIAVDSNGTVYAADETSVLQITPEGEVRNLFPISSGGYDSNSNRLKCPIGLSLDAPGNLYVADCGNSRILRFTTDRVLRTVASTGIGALTPLYNYPIPSEYITLTGPRSVAVDRKGAVYVSDYPTNRVVRFNLDDVRFEAPTVSTVAMTETNTVTSSAITLDPDGNLYVGDSGRVLKMTNLFDLNGNIGKLYIGGLVTTVAGNRLSAFGGDGGPAISARLDLDVSSGIALDATSNLYIADSRNNRVRKISSAGAITTVAGNGTFGIGGIDPATSFELGYPSGLTVDAAGNVYFGESATNRVRKLTNGSLTIVAGTSPNSILGPAEGPATTSARMSVPLGLAVDSAGNVYIADSDNQKIQRLNLALNRLTNVAGTGTAGFGGDGGLATAAALSLPSAVAIDRQSNLYVADRGNNRIRKVTAGGIISTVAGNGTPGFSGDGGPAIQAQLSAPAGVSVDAAGNLYVADTGNNRIRKVATSGEINTVAGNGTYGFSGDGGFAMSAQLAAPSAVAVDANGNLYVTDSGNDRIRKVELNALPRVGTFAGGVRRRLENYDGAGQSVGIRNYRPS